MNSKLSLFLTNLALQYSPFGGTEWDSSAQKLEKDLQACGINIKLYHKYKLPDGMSPSEFMVRIAVLDFSADFSIGRARDIWLSNKLSLREKAEVSRNVIGRRAKSRKKIREYAEQIKKLNPELQSLEIHNDFDAFDICSGAMFGFGLDEIRYFMDRKNRDMNKEHQVDKTLKRYGIVATYVLSPKTSDMIIRALEGQRLSSIGHKNIRVI